MSASLKYLSTPSLRRLGLAGMLGAALALSGCVVAPLGPAYVADDGMVVSAPYGPPPLQTEVIPVAPSPVSVWIGGYWGWGGGSYGWVPGRWERPPHAGWGWQPHRWQPGPRGGWQMHGGRWGPRR